MSDEGSSPGGAPEPPAWQTGATRSPENGIEAGRRPSQGRRAARKTASPTPDEESRRESGELRPGSSRADTDPWTVPQSVRDRFVQDGHRFYFPDGHAAFRDLGRRLVTSSENTQVVRSLIEIAEARGWSELTVTGSERFREEAWRQARLAGLNVRGFRASDEQQAQLVRALARSLNRDSGRVDSISEGGPLEGVQGASTRSSEVRIAGELIDHGKAAYRHDPKQDPSYLVRLKTREGIREIWGRDIERAIAKSLTQPQRGDEVVLLKTGQDAVTVRRRTPDATGELIDTPVETLRNRWVIERQAFFEARAAVANVVRDDSITPKEAVRRHPELTGTYLNLRAAELTSKFLRDPEDQRRFLQAVRSALAQRIERGERPTPVQLRERRGPEATPGRQLREFDEIAR
jgi:hypothetical protein